MKTFQKTSNKSITNFNITMFFIGINAEIEKLSDDMHQVAENLVWKEIFAFPQWGPMGFWFFNGAPWATHAKLCLSLYQKPYKFFDFLSKVPNLAQIKIGSFQALCSRQLLIEFWTKKFAETQNFFQEKNLNNGNFNYTFVNIWMEIPSTESKFKFKWD